MGLEAATYLNDLNVANPDGSVDAKSQGDDHLRLLKSVLKATLPGLGGRFRRIQVSAGAFIAALTDNTSVVRMTVASTVTLLAAATAGNGWELLVYNNSTGNVTLTPNGAEKINGLATVVIPPECFAIVLCQTGANVEYLAVVTPLTASGGAGADITGNISLAIADINGGIRRITATAVVTLPAIATVPIGRTITLKSVTTADVTWTPNGAETADGIAGVIRIPSYRSFTLQANTSDWIVIEEPDVIVGELRPIAAGVTAPKGFIRADKTSLLRTTFAGLFAVVGVTWGNVDGTHFNAPDYLGRSPLGDGTGAGLTARTVGQAVGTETVTLTAAQSGVPDHTHSINVGPNTGGLAAINGQATVISGPVSSLGVDGGAQNAASSHNNMAPVSVARFMVKT